MNMFIKKRGSQWLPLLAVVTLSSTMMAKELKKPEPREDYNQTQSVEWYAGLGLNMTTTTGDDCEDITYGFTAKVGYDYNQYIGVEGRAVQTNWEYEGAKVKHAGIFVKPMLPINEGLSLYGLLGYGTVSVGDKKDYSDSGLAWGVGLNYYFDDEEKIQEHHYTQTQKSQEDANQTKEQIKEADGRGLGIFVDYERLLEKSDAPDFDTISVGVSYDF